ncbi:MAG: tetratricopeptide repeat protein [Phycisphaerales bacterium]|nr:tetratricopeptide repeat protein [Phycisphaerales bacterium]
MMHRQLPAGVLIAIMLAGAHIASAQVKPGDDKSYRAGIGLLNKGMHDLAAIELRAYLKEHPDGAEAAGAHYALGVCLVKLGRHAEAVGDLDVVIGIKDFAFRPDAMLLRAQCSIANAEEKAGIQMLGRLLKEYPEFERADRAGMLQGETLYRAGRIEEAKSVLGMVASKWPKGPVAERAGLFLALAEAGSGDSRAAANRLAALRARGEKGQYAGNAALIEAQCRHRLGELKEAGSLYELAANSGDAGIKPEAMLGAAQVARAQGQGVQAAKLLEGLMAASPSPAVLAGAQMEQGRLLLDEGKADAALEAFGALAGTAPAGLEDDAAYWSAKCEIRLGRLAAACEHLADAAGRYPQSELAADMLFDRASALSRAGKDEEALPAWSGWRERFPKHELAGEALAAEAGCAHRLGRYDDSMKLCKEFLERNPKHARAAVVELLVAENQYLEEQYQSAEKSYARFLKDHAQDASAWRAQVRRGLCLVKLRRADEARDVLTRAIDAGGEHDSALRQSALSVLGERCFADGDWMGAQKWFAELASSCKGQAGEADALLRCALSIQRQGKFAEALPLFERAQRAAPGSPQALHARFEAGQAMVELGRLDEAQRLLSAVVVDEKGEPKPVFTPHALRHLAGIASKQGRPEEAAQILAQVADSGDSEAILQQASALLAAGKYAEAEGAYSKYLKSSPDAVRGAEARARRAIAINRQGRNEDAVRELTSLSGSLDGIDAEIAAGVRYELGLALRALSKSQEAASAYGSLLKAAVSSRLEAYGALDLAQINMDQERHAEAIVLLDRCRQAASKLEARDAQAVLEQEMYTRGVCLLKLGKAGEAADVLSKFGEKFSGSQLAASVWLVRGEALLKAGRAGEAAQELRRVVDAKGSDEVTSAALLRLGEALAAGQQWSRSEEACTAFLDRFPDSELWFQARFGQGWARENAGRPDAAIEAYRDVVQRHQGPTAARAQFQIGECLYAQKKHEEAAAELLKVDVLYAYPEWSAAALYEAGRCLGEVGRSADAAKQFEDLIARFPGTQWAKLAKDKQQRATPAPTPTPTPGHAREISKAR